MQSRFHWAVTFVVTAIVAIFISKAMATLGGKRPVQGIENSVEINEVGRYAVEEHNKQQNADLSFLRVAKAQQQTVAGTMYYLTVEAKGLDGNPKLYDAKVWVKPWEHFKKLEEFKPAEKPLVTSADLGVKAG
uniref:Cysteine proteinase inhibitor n=1 Tax=Wollemia nobilis TaxID=56998 RepID=A0A0C9QS49_9CONI